MPSRAQTQARSPLEGGADHPGDLPPDRPLRTAVHHRTHQVPDLTSTKNGDAGLQRLGRSPSQHRGAELLDRRGVVDDLVVGRGLVRQPQDVGPRGLVTRSPADARPSPGSLRSWLGGSTGSYRPPDWPGWRANPPCTPGPATISPAAAPDHERAEPASIARTIGAGRKLAGIWPLPTSPTRRNAGRVATCSG